MQGVVRCLISNCKFTKESSSEKNVNRLRFDRIMVMSLWPRFFIHPVYTYTKQLNMILEPTWRVPETGQKKLESDNVLYIGY